MRKVLTVLFLVLLVSGIGFAAHVDPALNEMVGKAKGLIPVIVEMQPGAGPIDVTAMGGKHGFTYNIINGFSAELPVAAIKALENNPNVKAISYDKEMRMQMNVASPTLNANFLWTEGYTGYGVTIAVVSTGIYPHTDFQNRIIGFKDFVNGRAVTYDDNGHGTYCAGGAAGNGPVYDGPARDANLVSVKVLNSTGTGSTSTIISGIDWCVVNKNTYSIDILVLSVGGSISQSSTTDPVCAAVRNALSNGIVVCVSTGNSGPTSSTITTPGNEPLVITCGASDDKSTIYVTDDTVASFSSRGPTTIDGWAKPDIVAPGVNVTTCDNAATGYITISGVSVANAILGGICAQYLEAYPGSAPATVKSAVKGAGRPLQGFDSNAQGSGLADAYYTVH